MQSGGVSRRWYMFIYTYITIIMIIIIAPHKCQSQFETPNVQWYTLYICMMDLYSVLIAYRYVYRIGTIISYYIYIMCRRNWRDANWSQSNTFIYIILGIMYIHYIYIKTYHWMDIYVPYWYFVCSLQWNEKLFYDSRRTKRENANDKTKEKANSLQGPAIAWWSEWRYNIIIYTYIFILIPHILYVYILLNPANSRAIGVDVEM